MNRENYKRLGDYIRLVDVRNRDLAVTNLLGVSISKMFIPSIANTIGTDMSTYKVVEPYQFAYGPVTSRNGDKITFALYKGAEKCIVSSAYFTFEVIDKEKLDPNYLMMWALRPEFDRYARFMSNGSAREMFSWDEMCEVFLPIPGIDEQRRIVAEYQAVEKRIAANEALIAKLEETAQTLFKAQFSRYNEDVIVSDGWRIAEFGEFCEIFTGKKDVNQSLPSGPYRFFSCSAENYYSDEFISKGPAVIIAGNGYTGRTVFSKAPFDLYQRAYACVPRDEKELSLVYFLYAVAKFFFEPSCQDSSRGTTIQYIVRGDLEGFKFTYNEDAALLFSNRMKAIMDYHISLSAENDSLKSFISCLLSKMTN